MAVGSSVLLPFAPFQGLGMRSIVWAALLATVAVHLLAVWYRRRPKTIALAPYKHLLRPERLLWFASCAQFFFYFGVVTTADADLQTQRLFPPLVGIVALSPSMKALLQAELFMTALAWSAVNALVRIEREKAESPHGCCRT